MKVFLGGTCNGSTWRKELISMLDEGVGYFNPVVDEWNEEAAQRELRERANDDYLLYVLTPLSESIYSVAEVVDDSNKRPRRTLMCIMQEDAGLRFTEHQKKALEKVGRVVAKNGGHLFENLEQVAEFLNKSSQIRESVSRETF